MQWGIKADNDDPDDCVVHRSLPIDVCPALV